jgi:hypothetical protein
MANPPTIHLRSIVVRKAGVLASEIDEDLVLMGPDMDKFYGTGYTGRRIWELLVEPRSLGEICDLLTEEFDITAAACIDQTQTFVQHLAAANLIDVVEA